MQQILKTLFKLLGVRGTAAAATGSILFLSLLIASPDYSKPGGQGPFVSGSSVKDSIVGNNSTIKLYIDKSTHYKAGDVINLTLYRGGNVINLNLSVQQVNVIENSITVDFDIPIHEGDRNEPVINLPPSVIPRGGFGLGFPPIRQEPNDGNPFWTQERRPDLAGRIVRTSINQGILNPVSHEEKQGIRSFLKSIFGAFVPDDEKEDTPSTACPW